MAGGERETEAAKTNGGQSEVVLHTHRTSPFSQRVAIALAEKGIHYEEKHEDLGNKSEEFIALNPVHKQVPILVHKGRPIVESALIVEYVDEVWPTEPSLVPKDPYLRSVGRFWVDYINKFGQTLTLIVLANGEEWERAKTQTVEQFKTLERALEEPSRGKPYFLGSTIGIVDIAFAPFIPLLSCLGEKLGNFKYPSAEECPRIHAWIETLSKTPSVVDTDIDRAAVSQISESLFKFFRNKSAAEHTEHFKATEA